MTNKTIFGILVAIFLVSISALSYFTYKLYTTPKTKKPTPLVKITNIEGNSITKNITVDNKVVYEVEGSFTKSPEKYVNGPLYKGDFVVKNDILKQTIPTFLGTIDGLVIMGNYDTSFKGDSSWQSIPLSEFVPKITSGLPIKLRITYTQEAIGNNQQIYDAFADAIIKQAKFTIPLDFYLSTESVGIIK